jgi:hypothetical protein
MSTKNKDMSRKCKVSFSFLLNDNIGISCIDVTLPDCVRVTVEHNSDFEVIVTEEFDKFLSSQGLDRNDFKNIMIIAWSFYES